MDQSLVDGIRIYIELLRANGQEEKADSYAKKLCKFKDKALSDSSLGHNPTNN